MAMESGFIKFSRYIAEDFSKFCDRFIESRSLGYDAFLSLWKELSFDNLFAGHSEEKECNEFGRELLRAGADYMASFNAPVVRVLGIYMCYAVCQCYPFELQIKIRLTLEEWKDLVAFIEDVQNQISAGVCSMVPGKLQELYDVMYVFNLMRKDRAFSIAAMRAEVCLVTQATHDEDERLEELFTKPRAIDKIFTSDMLDKLTESVAEYELQKQRVMDKYPEIAKSLDVSTGDVVQKITKQLVSHENWKRRIKANKRHETSSDANDTEEDLEPPKPQASVDSENDIAERRKKIKVKAMGGKNEDAEPSQNATKKIRRPRKRKWRATHSVANQAKRPREEDDKDAEDGADETADAETLALLGDMLS